MRRQAGFFDVDDRLKQIASPATPHMADEAGAHFIMPVHHQTFHLSSEDFREPIERFLAALYKTPERIALREIGETFVLPEMPTFRPPSSVDSPDVA
jgi:hypothetical protein